MKKVIIMLVSVLAFAAVASAQPRTFGLRIGYGGEVSYQHYMGSNFVEADLGFLGGNGFYATGVYDFVFAQSGDFNFYAGPGASLGFYSSGGSSALSLSVVGQIGAEYQIPAIPMNISIDWRPGIGLLGYSGLYGSSIALSLRYRF